MKPFNLHLYGVTDSKYTNLPIEAQVEQAILGGVTFVQIREKNIPFEEYVDKGRRVKAVCDKYNVAFVINDDVNVAKAVDSTGVHVGQSDMKLSYAREILGNDKLIGVSANTLEEARLAQAGGADYVGVGAVFPTSTKDDVDVVGIPRLGDIVREIDIPVVAIGGIDKDNCKQVALTGADGIAVVSAIFGSSNIEQAARELYFWKNNSKA